MMWIWYVFSTIFIILGSVALIWGAYNVYCGIRYEDPYGDFYRGIQKLSFAAFIAMMLWAIGFPWGGKYFEWFKMLITEHAVTLWIIAVILFLTIGLPLIFFFACLIKWLFIDTRKNVNKTSSEDEWIRQGEERHKQRERN